MADKDITVWGMDAGKTGDPTKLFFDRNLLGLGWAKMGDLSKLPQTREAFKKRLIEVYPGKKPGAVPIDAGQLYRFVCKMREDEVIAFSPRHSRTIHHGHVSGPYSFDLSIEPTYPHHRPVKWVKTVDRTLFSQGALYEIGSAMSLFQLRNYADEFLAAMEGKPSQIPVTKDDTVAAVSEDIEETTRDFVLKTLSQELKGHPLAEFVGHLLEVMGYKTRVSPPGSDDGVDVLAHKDDLGFVPSIIKVQVKSGDGTIGDPELSALYGKVGPAEFGLFVTVSKFSPKAIVFAKAKTNLRLINGSELVDLILQYYEQFDSRYKALLPMKRVYIPEPLEESD